jgi:hypothetical protein
MHKGKKYFFFCMTNFYTIAPMAVITVKHAVKIFTANVCHYQNPAF